jgi:hypothetical protein
LLIESPLVVDSAAPELFLGAVSAVPEPASCLPMLIGLFGWMTSRRLRMS